MKQRALLIFLMLTAPVLCAGDAPTVDLFAGWSWSPFPYYDYPYRSVGYPFWRPWPHAGVSVPLDGCDDTQTWFPYGYYGYEPFWGYEYGIRLKLNGTHDDPSLSAGLLPPPPGSAPLQPHDPLREKSWDRDIESFLSTLDPEGWKRAETNTPPQKSAPLH